MVREKWCTESLEKRIDVATPANAASESDTLRDFTSEAKFKEHSKSISC